VKHRIEIIVIALLGITVGVSVTWSYALHSQATRWAEKAGSAIGERRACYRELVKAKDLLDKTHPETPDE
jgi:hypothetical protein